MGQPESLHFSGIIKDCVCMCVHIYYTYIYTHYIYTHIHTYKIQSEYYILKICITQKINQYMFQTFLTILNQLQNTNLKIKL